MPFRNNSVKQIGWKAKNKRTGGENGTYTNVTNQRRHAGPPMIVTDQMTFLATRSAARILIKNLRHGHALPLTRPAVLLGEGRLDTREGRKSSLLTKVISLHELQLINVKR